ncbi:MAG TPA: hypothetical protein VHP33_18595 [Polyangiaceae bacterium]|nr:hypothetical protein [Polyangiaceae bacterium]
MRASRYFAAIFAVALSGCVQQAVLENDVRSAQWKARTLSTAANIHLAFAALSAQLVELEALHQRDPSDARVLGLLDRGYRLLAHGFIELRHLEALAAADSARAEQEARLRTDAEARARYYRERLGSGAPKLAPLAVESAFTETEAACARHDRNDYEQRLTALLAGPEQKPEARLERALVRRIAAAWLLPSVAARCKF